MSSTQNISVTIKGLVPTPSGSGVFLTDGNKVIAIFVDPNVAAAITMFLQKLKKPRPLTHDLIGNMFSGLGIKAQKVIVNDLKEDTFYARLHLIQESELGTNIVEIDSRPSDAIAISLQQGCPIYVSPSVWERAEDMSWALDQAKESAGNIPGADEGPSDTESAIDEFLKSFENMSFDNEDDEDDDDDSDLPF